MTTTITTEAYPRREGIPTIMDRWSRSLVLKMLGKIKHGCIVLKESEKQFIFGEDNGLKAVITVNHPGFYRKVLFAGSIGAGEAYVERLWDADDLARLVRIMVLNMSLLDRMERGFAWLLRPLQLLKHWSNRNSKNGSRRNILSHYDLGNEMYRSFLDATMMYSSAIYPTLDSSLEEASLNKLEIICRKLELKPADKVIEIGAGWGGFAIYAAQNYGCHVTTTTISDAQYAEAEKRIAQAGLSDKITLLRKDYRELSGRYDKLVSIEMIEAVGHKYLPKFFEKCGRLLKEDGVMLLQAITIADQRYDLYVRSVDFLQRHIFPGGCVPSNLRMLQLISAKSDMVVRHLEDFGFDYARTLKDWRVRFNNAFTTLKARGYDETFRRLWEFYLAYCEGGFWERSISVVHIIATRPGNRSFARI